MQISGSVALVTGGASGIGAALARRLDAEGARVAVADVDAPGAAAVADGLDGGGVAVEADVTDPAANRRMLTTVGDRLGPVDLLCLNAGIATGEGVDAPLEDWRRVLDVNVLAHVHALRAWLPGAVERGGGHVLHTASAAGLLTMLGDLPYSVSKHAVVALAEWLAITYGDAGIGVSCLCPQFVRTPLFSAFEEAMPGGLEGMGETKTPGEVADVTVAALAEDRFLILPHPEVADYVRVRAGERERWLAGMRRLQRRGAPTRD